MKYFFSCDWGTSSFRLRWMDAEQKKSLHEIKTDHGIARCFEKWKQQGGDEKIRLDFYRSYLLEQIKKIPSSVSTAPEQAPILISGMASSSIGMLELPYKELPFHTDGSDLITRRLPKHEGFPYNILMISGARTESDTVRGEETMLAGCNVPADDAKRLYIFPGTHSKHISVQNGAAMNIKTFMTGEFFDLLANKSILRASVEKGNNEIEETHFAEAVLLGSRSNLLNSSFRIRTNQLFGKLSAIENYHYLSGLLIGHELKELAEDHPGSITLVCDESLKKQYISALTVLGLHRQLQYADADESLISGQIAIGLNGH